MTNMVLDALFIAVFEGGVVGAAAATATSQFVGGMVPFIFFARKNGSKLHLTKTSFMGRELLRTCTNGSSELVTNVSLSLVCMLYNMQLLKFAGENGVAAYGVIMYVNFIFVSIYLGYSFGTAPIVAFNYGARNTEELQNVLKKSLKLLLGAGITLTAVAMILSGTLSKVFVGYDAELYAMTLRGFRLYAISYLLCGFNIYGSSFFTALNNGLISATISFVRTLICQIAAVMLLPLIFGLDGIWFSVVAAELVALILTVVCFIKFKGRYHYM